MIVGLPNIFKTHNSGIYVSKINFLDEEKYLYFSVDKKYFNMITTFSDPLLISLLIPAMRHKQDIIIEGNISKKLFNNIDNIQEILLKVIPYLSKVSIKCNIIEEHEIPKKNIISAFSAGIDAFTTFQDYYLEPKYNKKITHFIFNNIGLGNARIAYKIKNIQSIVDKYRFPFIQTWSNLHNFYLKGQRIGFEQTHTIRNAAIAHFLGGEGNNFLYSSTFHLSKINAQPSTDLAIVDNILLPLLSTPRVKSESVGSEYTRLEKTRKVAYIEDAHKHLDICIGKQGNGFLNCGICRKCTRALLTLELESKEKSFKDVFNFEQWQEVRSNYIDQLENRTQLNDKELYNYIKENNYEI
jgi:hypothetical protein